MHTPLNLPASGIAFSCASSHTCVHLFTRGGSHFVREGEREYRQVFIMCGRKLTEQFCKKQRFTTTPLAKSLADRKKSVIFLSTIVGESGKKRSKPTVDKKIKKVVSSYLQPFKCPGLERLII